MIDRLSTKIGMEDKILEENSQNWEDMRARERYIM